MHYLSKAGPVVGVAIGLVVLIGCNRSKFDLADVAGRVVLDGEPVPEAKVVFMPTTPNDDGESGPYSMGVTDADGRYELATVEQRSRAGAVIGAHRVIVSTKKSRLDPDVMDREIIEVPESIPWRYTYYKETPLTFDVPQDGTDSGDFSLTTPEQ